FLDTQFLSVINTIASSGPAIADVNSIANVGAVGVGNPSYTIDNTRNRTSVRSRLTDVQVSTRGKLSISYSTLATKIALCTPRGGGLPTAYGVDIAVGGAIAVASNFNGKGRLNQKLVTARHEVIVSAGVFQSPQLVGLSGIGNKTELQKVGIPSVVDLPGVGLNLQGKLTQFLHSKISLKTGQTDHDEVASVWSLKENFTLLNGCTFLYTVQDDPCLENWQNGVYGQGPALFTTMAKSDPSLTQPDLFTYWLTGYFRGFFKGFA
ncbi:GMC oxidoreductase-domain-containing protein, partial [Mycena epipterygia]